MDKEIKKCYQILELDETASAEDVKRAWRQMAKVWHPDRFPNDESLQQKALEKLKGINAAYESLNDYLANPQPPRPRPPPPPQSNQQTQAKTPRQSNDTFGESETIYCTPCEHCGFSIEFPEPTMGDKIYCPNCNKLTYLPYNATLRRKAAPRQYTPHEHQGISQESNSKTKTAFVVIGSLCVVFSLIDFAGMYFHYDITGVPWSPLVAGGVGGVFLKMAGVK